MTGSTSSSGHRWPCASGTTRTGWPPCPAVPWSRSPASVTSSIWLTSNRVRMLSTSAAGSGLDAFYAAGLVGPTGRVYGVDYTEEQLDKARRLAESAGISQVEFLEGRIEALPLPDASVDCVISNGVINLCPDKKAVFAEAARVVRAGGRLAIADIISEQTLTDSIVCNADLWASCIGGAAQQELYLQAIESAGFTIDRHRVNAYEFISEQARNASAKYGVKSILLLATKTAD